MSFDYLKIEEKWLKFWDENKSFYCDVHDFKKPKYYVLDMFPYTSGQGLHVGHVRNYTASDIIARKKRMDGYNVLHPMGFDAFGLPAEQYAMTNNADPEEFTRKNIEKFKTQIKRLGFSYDWSKELATIDEEYYKWTQWIFLQLYKKGLAYEDLKEVNYCPELKCVLANEEVINGKSERGGYDVIKLPMKQWVLKITAYAPQLLDGLKDIDWPKSTLEMQKNWIGQSFGSSVIFKVDGTNEAFDVFTTRVDTLFGCSYCVLAPEHPLVKKICDQSKIGEIDKYIDSIKSKSDMERTSLNKSKTGLFIGAYAINPINNKKVPIYISDYVLLSYGSGAVMAVPAHDQRDYEFAKKFDLPIQKVLESDVSKEAFEGDAKHINSEYADGLNIADAKEVIVKKLEEKGLGHKTISYKIRDWVFSRQRYWGEPIPVLHEGDKNIIPLDESELPLTLPKLKNMVPGGDGSSPLKNATEWLHVNRNGKEYLRETNTMPQWAGSCWYFMRYLEPHNDKELCNKEVLDHWMPVDLYIGGAEHAVLHLLYARFWYKFLHDIGVVKTDEPFKKVFHQGFILGANNEKMSKSRGNVVNPDDMIEKYGTDALRLYEMFIGPLEAALPWSITGIEGCKRFLERVWRLYEDESLRNKISEENSHELDQVYNFTVKKVGSDIDNLQFNTAISQLMIFVNEMYKAKTIYKPYFMNFLVLLNPFAPFMTEEMNSLFGNKESLVFTKFPTFDPKLCELSSIEIPVTVNGKKRAALQVEKDKYNEKELENMALSLDAIKSFINGTPIKKVIVVKNKIINIVI